MSVHVMSAGTPRSRGKRRSTEYERYMRSDAWKAKRNGYWAVYGRACQSCGETENLSVHHRNYDRLGHELLTDLIGLCYVCHTQVHRMKDRHPGVPLTVVTEMVTGVETPKTSHTVTLSKAA